MIYISRVVTVSKGISLIDDQIILFKGDRNVEIQFNIKNNPFKSKDAANASYAQLIIDREAGPLFSEVAQVSGNRITFIVTGEMIDELDEVGTYDFQIRLFDQEQESRVTLPPVTAGIVINEPICEEAAAGITYVNNRRSAIAASNDPEDIFDDNGDYNRTNWYSGDIITDTKLNKIEEALYMINNGVSDDYATEEYVDDAVRRIENNYAKEDYVNDMINNNTVFIEGYVEDKYASKEELEEAIANVEGGNVDLTGYATEAYVNEAIGNIEIPEGNDLDIITIGNEDGSEYRLTCHEFYDEKFEFYDVEGKNVLFKNTFIDYYTEDGEGPYDMHYDELVYIEFGLHGERRRYSIRSSRRIVELYVREDDAFVLQSEYEYAVNRDIDFVNEALWSLEERLGDIDAILDSINGEEI